MAYDNLNNIELAKEIMENANMAENSMTRTLARAKELAARLQKCGGCVKDPEPEPEPEPELEPMPPMGGSVLPALAPAPIIPSNFNSEGLVGPSSVPPSAVPDVVGAFRFIARISHYSYDDPIVYPGKPGAAHLHEFFGNSLADAHSTYESLRTTGESLAPNKLNRTAYWRTALLDGLGNILASDHVAMYYKRRPANDPFWKTLGLIPTMQPNGIRWITGHHADGTITGGPYINCMGMKFYDLDQLCQAIDDGIIAREKIEWIKFIVGGPTTWNGKDLDVSDHRSHVGHYTRNSRGTYDIPEGHTHALPTVNFSFHHTILPDTDLTKLYLSSDAMFGTARGGSFHCDLWDAWDVAIKQEWEDNAINKLLNCSSGNLGSGRGLAHNNWGDVKAPQRLIPIDSIPKGMPMHHH